MDRDRFSGSLAIVSWYCRICTTTIGVDCAIYETPNEDEGTASLHMMLAKLFPTVFNESQVLSDKVMDWPSKICLDCKGKVIESYGLYELCTKSAQQLALLVAKQQTVTQTFQAEIDDHDGDIRMKLDCEDPLMLKVEYDSDDQSSECRGFESLSSTANVFTDIEDGQSTTESSLLQGTNVSSPAIKTQLNRSMKTTEGRKSTSRKLNKANTQVASVTGRFETSAESRLENIQNSEFHPIPLDSLDEMKKLERKLQDDTVYRKQLKQYLERKICFDTVPKRLYELIDIVFTKRLFASFSWTGVSRGNIPKTKMRSFINILSFLREASAYNGHIFKLKSFYKFIQVRLQRAKHRERETTGQRHTTCKQIFKDDDFEDDEESKLPPVMSEDETSAEVRLETTEIPEFQQNPMDSLDELQEMERKLQEDLTYRESLKQYLELNMYALGVPNRLYEVIDLLFTKRFFASISWTGVSRSTHTKIKLRSFTNVLGLARAVSAYNGHVFKLKSFNKFVKERLQRANIREKNCFGMRKAVCKQKFSVDDYEVEGETELSPGIAKVQIGNKEFVHKPIDSPDELEELERKLKEDGEYRERFKQYLEIKIYSLDVPKRLHEIIDLIFTQRFFATCSWTGISRDNQPKTKICSNQNILSVAREVSAYNGMVFKLRTFCRFIKERLQRANRRHKTITGLRISSCRQKFFDEDFESLS